MNRNEIMWVLECCLLALDEINKKQMLEFGCPRNLAEMGIELFDYLNKKEVGLLVTQ